MNDFLTAEEKLLNIHRKSQRRDMVRLAVVFALGVIGGLTTLAGIKYCAVPQPAAVPMKKSHGQEVQLADYFRKNGSPTPQALAEACLATKSPRLMAAIAVKESNGNPSVRNTGWKKRHSGAWQVSKVHGRVPNDITEQALQAELVLDGHLKDANGNIVKALNGYGGDKSRKVYAMNILKELQEVPR